MKTWAYLHVAISSNKDRHATAWLNYRYHYLLTEIACSAYLQYYDLLLWQRARVSEYSRPRIFNHQQQYNIYFSGMMSCLSGTYRSNGWFVGEPDVMHLEPEEGNEAATVKVILKRCGIKSAMLPMLFTQRG